MYKCNVYKKILQYIIICNETCNFSHHGIKQCEQLATGKRPVKENIAENSPNLFDS